MAGIMINFDSGIEKVEMDYGSNSVTHTESGYGDTLDYEPGNDIVLTATLKTGYSLKDAVITKTDVGTITGTISGNIVTIPESDIQWNSSFAVNLITQGEVPRKSYDLSTSAKWATLTAGNHNVQIVAKASGYRDSEKSAAVTVNKTIISAGTYKFNDTISAPASGSATAFIHFKVNDTSYNSISATSLVSVMYTATLGEGLTVYNNTDKWAAVDTANQIITITADKEVSYKFYEWFMANASAYTPTYTLEAGTYNFANDAPYSSKAIFQALTFVSYPTNGISDYVEMNIGGNVLGFRYLLDGVKKGVTVNRSVDNPVWKNDGYKTITLSTDQQVSADFYNWAITDGNLVKQVEPTSETWLLKEQLNSSSLTLFDINFVSNNASYISLARDYNPSEDFDVLIYSRGSTSSDDDTAYSNGSWTNG